MVKQDSTIFKSVHSDIVGTIKRLTKNQPFPEYFVAQDSEENEGIIREGMKAAGFIEEITEVLRLQIINKRRDPNKYGFLLLFFEIQKLKTDAKGRVNLKIATILTYVPLGKEKKKTFDCRKTFKYKFEEERYDELEKFYKEFVAWISKQLESKKVNNSFDF